MASGEGEPDYVDVEWKGQTERIYVDLRTKGIHDLKESIARQAWKGWSVDPQEIDRFVLEWSNLVLVDDGRSLNDHGIKTAVKMTVYDAPFHTLDYGPVDKERKDQVTLQFEVKKYGKFDPRFVYEDDATDLPEYYAITGKSLPTGLNFNESTGIISGTVDRITSSFEDYDLTVTAFSGSGDQVKHYCRQKITVTVCLAKHPTDFVYSQVQNYNYGEPFNLIPLEPASSQQESSCFTEGMQMTFSADNMPAGVSINNVGVVHGRVTHSRTCLCGLIACNNNCCCPGTTKWKRKVQVQRGATDVTEAEATLWIADQTWHNNVWTRAIKDRLCNPSFCIWMGLAIYFLTWGIMLIIYSLSDSTPPFWQRHQLQCSETGSCYLWITENDEAEGTWRPGTTCYMNQWMAGAGIVRIIQGAPFLLVALWRLLVKPGDDFGRRSEALIVFVPAPVIQVFWFIWLIIGSVRTYGDFYRDKCDDDVYVFCFVSLILMWLEFPFYTLSSVYLAGEAAN